MPREQCRAGPCCWVPGLDLLSHKHSVLNPQTTNVVPVTHRRQMPFEETNENVVISLLAITQQKSMLYYSLPCWIVSRAVSAVCVLPFLLVPCEQQSPHHYTIGWMAAFRQPQQPSRLQGTVFPLGPLSSEQTTSKRKAAPGAWAAPQTQLVLQKRPKNVLVKQSCPRVDLWLAPSPKLLAQHCTVWKEGREKSAPTKA